MTITLRPHQELAIKQLRDSIAAGNKRVMLAAPCSFGKTRVAAWILAEAAKRGKKGVFICDRIKLIDQALEDFDSHGLKAGVIQGQHSRWNPDADIQICSIQTLARRRDQVAFDIGVIDEAHTLYKSQIKYFESYNAVPFIGLSATPFSKGLGMHYDDLVVPATAEDLLDECYLTPVRYFSGSTIDTKGVKTKAMRSGGSDFDEKAMGEKMEGDVELAGDIIKTWQKHGENSQTIAFCPTIAHSKFLVEQFRKAGISAEHVDGYMDVDDRDAYYEAHDRGEFKILSCSQLLNTGYDAPSVKCLIDCKPTKSLIAFVQRSGRIWRLAEGKEYAIHLDHAGNLDRLGLPHTVVPESMDDGEKQFQEKNQTKETKESKPRHCPECYQAFTGLRCSCGYEVPFEQRLVTDGTILQEIKEAKKVNAATSYEEKAQFYGELLLYGRRKGFKAGWAMNKYREKFGVWPNKVRPREATELSTDTANWIKHLNIKWAKGKRT
jgi:superfamily II DNA or RNA helicase